MFPSLWVSKTHALEGLPYETIVDLMTTGLTRVRLQRFSVGEQMFPMLLHLLLEKRDCIGLQGEAVTVQEFAMLAVRPEGEPRVSWGPAGS